MNAFLSLDGIELWHLAGWTMVHFLWLGALVVAAAAVCRFLLRRTSPSIRYAFMCAWLLALAALPFSTAAWLYQNSPPLKGGAGGGIVSAITPSLIELHNPSNNTTPVELALQSPPTPNQPLSTAVPLSAQSAIRNPQSEIENTPTTFWPSTLNPRPSTIAALTTLIPYLPWLWLIGTPITFALLITGVVGTRRLNRASQPITEGPIAALLSQLNESLRIGRRVTVAVCDRIAAPVLIGILRPVILLPPAALTGWSPDEIEMVLLHELAHVRRWDNLMNLLQRVVESLLFFHPAVWIVSSWVRSDREACCDALVVRRTNRPHAYATMLVNLAASIQPSPSGRGQGEGAFPAARGLALHSAMAAGPLRSRIRRILQLEDDPMLVSGKSFVLVLAALAVAATLGVLYVPTIGEAKEKPTKATKTVVDNKDEAIFGGSEDGSDRPLPSPFATNEELQYSGDNQPAAASFDHVLPPVPPTNDMLAEALSKNNMKTISLASLMYNDQHKTLPPHAIYSKDGKPLLSWRVALLPYLGDEEHELYKQFHLDEPWDSEHNRKLVASIPILFVIPKAGLPPVYAGKTNYLAVVGPECVFDGTAKGRGLKHITDGSSNTIAFVEANVDQAVEWTKPADWEFDPAQPTKGLGTVWTGHWNASYVDGSQKQISNNTPADVVSAQFTRAGGEVKQLQESADRPQPPFGEPPIGLPGALAPPGTAAAAFAENPFGDLTPVTNPEGLVADDWPMGVAFPSPKEGKISADAWHKLKIKVVPAAKQEQDAKDTTEIKVVAGIDPPPGIKNPVFLLAINDHPARTFDELAAALAKLKNEKIVVAKCVTTADFGPLWIDTALDPSGDPRRSIRRESGVPPAASAATAAKSPSKFPSLEDQKLADLAFKRLNLELEPIGADDLQRVKALGYDGGLKVAAGSAGVSEGGGFSGNPSPRLILPNDILVGLHAWPTTSMNSLSEVLNRDDLIELNPLKFYVVRRVGDPNQATPLGERPTPAELDKVVSGRVIVNIDHLLGGRRANPTRNATSTSSDAWPSTPTTNTWPPANPNDLWQSAPAAGPPLEPAYPQGRGGAAPATQPVRANDLPGVPKSPFQTLPTAPALNSNDPYVAPPGNAPTLAPPPTERAADPPLSTSLNFSNAAPSNVAAVGVAEPLVADSAPPLGSQIRARTTPNGQTVYESFAPPTVNSTSSDKSNLRYDGKTFDQWRTIWQTELSTEKRLEGIKALAAFGRAGYGKDATETILDVASEYDFSVLEGKEAPEGALKETVLEALTPQYRPAKLAEFWVPEITARAKKDPKKWHWLTMWLFGRLHTDDPKLRTELQSIATSGPAELRQLALNALVMSDRSAKPGANVDKQTRDLIDAALESKDLDKIRSTLPLLLYNANSMGGGGWGGGGGFGGGMAAPEQAELLSRPGLLPLLFNSDESIRRQARQVLSNISEQDSGDVIKYLLGVLNDKSRERDHLEAVRALAAVAHGGRLHMQELNAVAELQKICKDPKSENQMFLAALVGLDGVYGPSLANGDSQTLNKFFSGSSEEELMAILKRFREFPEFTQTVKKETATIFNKPDPNAATNAGSGVF